MALIKCPECGKEISDKASSCINCGCPSEVIQEKLEQEKIENAKPKMVKACSTCGLIVWNKDALGYKRNYCIECKSRKILHELIELPVSCEEFEKKLYVKKSELSSEINKYSNSIRNAQKELFEQYVENWDSLDMTTESYGLNFEELYWNGRGSAHDALVRQVNEKLLMDELNSTTSNIPKCFVCGSSNIRKISVSSKVSSVAIWGIFSQKIKKQWHCNNCGSEW